jgi:cytochrome c oxidase assembly protein subunit 15
LSLLALVLIFAQILLGGFVAGLDAGLTYNTWPLMDGEFVPQGAYASVPVWLAPFEDVTTVQFNHRMMAYIVSAAVLALFVYGLRQRLTGHARLTLFLLVATVGLQMVLGIATLLAEVPVWLGASHQFGAVLLLTASLLHAYALRRNV